MDAIEVDRNTLYEEVWATPMSRLAREYGVSDVALKKACLKLNVPTPPRGYWAKLRHGHDVPRPPLPSPKPGAPNTYRVREGAAPLANQRERHPPPLPPGLDPPPAVEVPETLRNPDPLVRATKAALDSHHTDDYGRVRSHDAPLAVDVSREHVPRALRLMNAAVCAARRLGFELRQPGGGGHAQLVIEGEPVAFGVRERARRYTVPKSERAYGSDSGIRYRPSGLLELGVGDSPSAKYRRWRDTEKAPVEERVGEFLVGAYLEAIRQRKEREWWEAYWREQERKREEERQRAEAAALEKARRERLEAQAERWARSHEVAAFVDAVEARAAERELSDDEKDRLAAWVRWARAHAERLDPLSRGFPHAEPDPPAPRAPHRLLF